MKWISDRLDLSARDLYLTMIKDGLLNILTSVELSYSSFKTQFDDKTNDNFEKMLSTVSKLMDDFTRIVVMYPHVLSKAPYYTYEVLRKSSVHVQKKISLLNQKELER